MLQQFSLNARSVRTVRQARLATALHNLYRVCNLMLLVLYYCPSALCATGRTFFHRKRFLRPQKSAAIGILQSKSWPPMHFSIVAYSNLMKRRRWFSCRGERVWKLSRDKTLDPGSDILGLELSDGGCLQSSGRDLLEHVLEMLEMSKYSIFVLSFKMIGIFSRLTHHHTQLCRQLARWSHCAAPW